MFKPLTVEEWNEEINHGLEFRQRFGNEKSWADLEAIFYNVHPSQMNAGPNVLFSTGDALMSELNVPDPSLSLTPLKPDLTDATRLQETVDNQLISAMKMSAEVANATLAAYIYGVGFLKIGFDSEFGWDPDEDIGGAKLPQGLTLSQRDNKGNLIEYGDVQPGMPWIKSVLPHDIVVPYGTRTLKEAPWIAHRVVRHIDDVKADAKYSGKKDLLPTLSMEDYVKSYQTVMKPYRMGATLKSSFGERESKFCELWEIHDKKSGRIFVIATGHDKFLRDDDNLLQLNGLPFLDISFTPRARNIWVTSDAHYLKMQQAELSDITVQQTKLRRSMNFKLIYDEDAFDESELTKLNSHDAGVGVKMKAGHDIEKSIKFVTPPPNYELQNQAQGVLQNLKLTVGFNSNSFGEYQSGRKTASEVNAVQEGASQRMSRRQSVIRDVYIDAFRKINPMIQNFWVGPRLMQVVGAAGIPVWRSFTGQHLIGEYSYSCAFSESAPKTKEQRQQEAIQMFATLAQMPGVDIIALIKFIAEKFNDIEFSSIFQPGILNGTGLVTDVQPQSGGAASGPQGGAGGAGGSMGPSGNQQAAQGLPRVQAAQSQQRQQSSSGPRLAS